MMAEWTARGRMQMQLMPKKPKVPDTIFEVVPYPAVSIKSMTIAVQLSPSANRGNPSDVMFLTAFNLHFHNSTTFKCYLFSAQCYFCLLHYTSQFAHTTVHRVQQYSR